MKMIKLCKGWKEKNKGPGGNNYKNPFWNDAAGITDRKKKKFKIRIAVVHNGIWNFHDNNNLSNKGI